MTNTTISPNMGLPIPVVGVDPGPDYANNIDSCLNIVDSHNHSSGQGVQINPSGLNINSDLPINGNNITTLRTTRYTAQLNPIAASAPDLGCLYVAGADLYYNDENGNQVRITQSGSVTGAAGTITGLPSGTASVSYSAGTFTFQSATNTPANMAVGPVAIGNNVANSKTVTISPNAGIASNYNFTLPASLPAAANYTTLDNSGNFSYNTAGSTGTGAVVLQASPTLTATGGPVILTAVSSTVDLQFIRTGTSSGGVAIIGNGGAMFFTTGTSGAPETTVAGQYLTTTAWTLGSSGASVTHTVNGYIAPTLGVTFPSGTMTDYKEGTWTPTITGVSNYSSSSVVAARYQQIGHYVNCVVQLSVTATTTSCTYTMSLPIAPANNFSANDQCVGTAAGSHPLSGYVTFSSSSKLAQVSIAASSGTISSDPVVHTFTYIINN